MSLPETITFGGSYSIATPAGGVAFNKARFGAYVSTLSTADKPVRLDFTVNNRNGGVSDYLVKYTVTRNVDPSSGIPGGRVDNQLSVWLKCLAPQGPSISGGFTPAEIEASILDFCYTLIKDPTLVTRLVRGET